MVTNSTTGRFPTTEQGLEALIHKPQTGVNAKYWPKGGYLEKQAVPLDPWKHPYVYISPGMHSPDYDLISLGADGLEGEKACRRILKAGGRHRIRLRPDFCYTMALTPNLYQLVPVDPARVDIESDINRQSHIEVNMFGIGLPELVMILVLGLLVLGPKRLPEVARVLGRLYGQLRRASDDFQRTIRQDLDTIERQEDVNRNKAVTDELRERFADFGGVQTAIGERKSDG